MHTQHDGEILNYTLQHMDGRTFQNLQVSYTYNPAEVKNGVVQPCHMNMAPTYNSALPRNVSCAHCTTNDTNTWWKMQRLRKEQFFTKNLVPSTQ